MYIVAELYMTLTLARVPFHQRWMIVMSIKAVGICCVRHWSAPIYFVLSGSIRGRLLTVIAGYTLCYVPYSHYSKNSVGFTEWTNLRALQRHKKPGLVFPSTVPFCSRPRVITVTFVPTHYRGYRGIPVVPIPMQLSSGKCERIDLHCVSAKYSTQVDIKQWKCSLQWTREVINCYITLS